MAQFRHGGVVVLIINITQYLNFYFLEKIFRKLLLRENIQAVQGVEQEGAHHHRRYVKGVDDRYFPDYILVENVQEDHETQNAGYEEIDPVGDFGDVNALLLDENKIILELLILYLSSHYQTLYKVNCR